MISTASIELCTITCFGIVIGARTTLGCFRVDGYKFWDFRSLLIVGLISLIPLALVFLRSFRSADVHCGWSATYLRPI